MATTRIIACGAIIVATATGIPASAQQRVGTAANDAAIITVQMSNFAFAPAHLNLRSGVPVRLRLVNESSGGHDFSAPAFFAASSFPAGSAPPPKGEVAVGSRQTIELTLTPRVPGTYRLECTHFLHSFFGMHGTIDVLP